MRRMIRTPKYDGESAGGKIKTWLGLKGHFKDCYNIARLILQ